MYRSGTVVAMLSPWSSSVFCGFARKDDHLTSYVRCYVFVALVDIVAVHAETGSILTTWGGGGGRAIYLFIVGV